MFRFAVIIPQCFGRKSYACWHMYMRMDLTKSAELKTISIYLKMLKLNAEKGINSSTIYFILAFG